ncbi:Plus-3 [Cynara cardunculus var. scolymus]|uniref:Plus-3 n=1 Tax=Cynara cardunculus var. scolymus TaxID=59895 RepID=A0A124SBP6_CYNCS|nr:Plus-3 [Cynara cardunculus var. scolymus]
MLNLNLDSLPVSGFSVSCNIWLMTDVNDPKADSGLAINITNQWKNSSTAAGAGANANSRVDLMTFVGSDTLAELVWSPGTGLSIKFAEKKPCFTCEVGPSNMGFLQSEDTQDQKHVNSSSTVETSTSRSHGHAGLQNQRTSVPSSERLFVDGMTSGVDKSGSDIISPLKIEASAQCGPHEHVEMAKMDKDGCSSDPFRENAQDVEQADFFPGEDREGSIYCREKDQKHEVESHGSMESCKNATSVAKRKRRLRLEEQLILGSKRIKKQADHDQCMVKEDKSFVNWMSNMLKGLKEYKNYDQRMSVYDETRGFESQKMGFQNFFQSLFLPDVKAHDQTIKLIENNYVGSSKEIDKCGRGSIDCLEIEEKEIKGVVEHISLYERVTKEAPKGMFDTIRRLRLSRTDIMKWTNSRLSVAHLDGFFVRLRLAKWEEGAGGSRYYVACVTGFKQSIRVKVGRLECFVESQYVSNCDFLEDELIAWWQETSKNEGIPGVKDLKSKLAERRTLGL